ncbi:MAG: ATP-binding cassette domain-containing protein, partial [Dermatophilaceae bacterium]
MFGRFEADRPNARWVGDALHGPQVEGRKAILIAFLDDHSRAIVAARWVTPRTRSRCGRPSNSPWRHEGDPLRSTSTKRGKAMSVLCDEAACFIDAGLRRAPAALGIKLTHSPPGKPAGRGKIEGPSRRNAAGECRCEGRFRYGCGVVLQALEVSHSFGDRVVLDEVTLRVRPGVLTGLLGPNGAGKTTLLRLLLGVIEADAGRFVLDCAPVTAAERQRWGYMPQERGLYPAMAAGAQVVYFGRLHGLSGADATRRARDLLAEVGLSDRWGERTDRLSGGQ